MNVAFHLIEATVESIHAAMRAGQLSARELVKLYLSRIETYDQHGPMLNGIQTVNPAALAEAERMDAEMDGTGPFRPLHGIPVLVKDQLETSDMPTTFGSALFKGFVPTRTATVINRLRAAGAVILAKNTMSELAQPGFHGSAFGHSRNPYDPSRSSGGSSCGTGVSVAANLGVVGVGEDTGGSIRGPASYCGLVGLRPTLGLVSRFGMLPGTPSRDTLGPMARTVRDAAVLLEVLAGYDPGDPITASTIGNVPLSYGAGLNADGLKGARLGVIREPIGQNIDTEAADHLQIRAAIRRALDEMSDRGAEIVDAIPAGRILELLHRPFGGGETEAAVDRYLSSHANAPVHSLREIVLSADHLVLPSQRAQLAESLGKSTSDPGYLQNLLNREAVRQEVLKVMADHALDALVFATMERSPPAIPADLLTSSATVRSLGSNGALSPATGFPQLTVPCGVTDDGLPVGLSLLGRPFSEESLLRMAYAYEQARPHRAPPKAAPTLPGEP